MIQHLKFLWLATLASLLSTFPIHATLASGGLQTIAVTGDQAPGAPAGVVFGRLGAPTLNNNGEIRFAGQLLGNGVDTTNDTGLFAVDTADGLSLLAREGDPAPGLPSGVSLDVSFSVQLNDSGQTVFIADLSGAGVNDTNDSALFFDDGAAIEVLVREGDPAPSTTTGVTFDSLFSPALNNGGQFGFSAILDGVGVNAFNNFAIFIGDSSGGVSLIARKGDPAPETPAGVNLGSLDFPPFGPAIFSDGGETAFVASLSGAGVDASNDAAIFSGGSSGSLSLVAREGDAAPGTAAGVSFGSLTTPRINNNGETAFLAFLTGTGVDTTNNAAFFNESNEALELVARAGDQAPGIAGDVTFGTQFGFAGARDLFNEAGQTAFFVDLNGTGVDETNDSALFSEDNNGDLALVARTGDQAPGTTPGIAFESFVDGATLNENGQIAFLALLTEGVDPSTGDTIPPGIGLFAQDLTGELQLIARDGDSIDVSDDPQTPDLQTIGFIDFFSVLSEGVQFNDAGQVAFSVFLDDISTGAIVVSDLVAIPEPTAMLLMIIGSTGALGTRRRAYR